MNRRPPHLRRHLVSVERLHLAPRPPAVPERGETVAFVFEGGGSLTATQVGTLRALVEAGVRADFVIGSSAGALNAVMFAVDPTLAGLDRMEAIWAHLRRRTVAPLSPGTLARAVTGRGISLVSDRGLRELLLAHVPITRLDDAALPVVVVATDRETGEPVVLAHEPVVEALLASSAFPGLYPPVTLGGRTLVDGGVSANTPVLQAEEHGASVCFVLPCATQDPFSERHAGAMSLAQHALNQILEANSRHDLFDARSTVHVLPVPSTAAAHPVDFRDTDRLIAQSYRLAGEELSALGACADSTRLGAHLGAVLPRTR